MMNYRDLYLQIVNDHFDKKSQVATTSSGECVTAEQLQHDLGFGAFWAWEGRPAPSDRMFFHTLLPGAKVLGDLPHRDIYPYLTARSLRFAAYVVGHDSSPHKVGKRV